MRPVMVLVLIAGFGMHGASLCMAHPVSVTRTSVFVTREQATARIEVFLEDLFLFHDLTPNDQDFLEPDEVRRGIELHKEFVSRRFTIRDLTGEALKARDVRLQEFDLPEEGVPLAELMAHNLTFELRYELPQLPEFFTFTQRFTDEKAFLPSEMHLQVKQENAGMPFSMALVPNKPVTVRFSWENPPLTAEASDEEWESWFTKQQEETLGITSYSSVYSFLYIDDYEVRHEILIPLLTLDESVVLAHDGDEFLDIAEQDAARESIEAYFGSGNPIEIDGVETSPVVERCDFYGLDLKDFALQAPRKQVSIVSARVGIILSYRCANPAQTVKLTWNRFNSYVWSVNTVVITQDTTSNVMLSRLGKNNVFEWENPGRPVPAPLEEVAAVLPPEPTLSLPLLSVACFVVAPMVWAMMRISGTNRRRQLTALAALVAVAAIVWPFVRWEVPQPFAPRFVVPDHQAQTIFSSLHRNVYRALDFHDESDLYNALEKSIHGDQLSDVYLQIRKGLEMQEQGGAVSRVSEVAILSGENGTLPDNTKKRDRGAFAYRSRWNVAGTVEHWGHIHERTNQYEALFVIEPIAGAWKITDLSLTDEQRLQFRTRLRGLAAVADQNNE